MGDSEVDGGNIGKEKEEVEGEREAERRRKGEGRVGCDNMGEENEEERDRV
jgi:hypothetical protein